MTWPSTLSMSWSPSPFITSVFTLLLLISSRKARLPTCTLALFISVPLNVMFPVQKLLFFFPFSHRILPKSHFPSEASQATLLLTFRGPQGKSNWKKVNHHFLPLDTHHTPSAHRVLSRAWGQGWPQNTAAHSASLSQNPLFTLTARLFYILGLREGFLSIVALILEMFPFKICILVLFIAFYASLEIPNSTSY